MTESIYEAPRSDLQRAAPAGNYGSLERGIAGDYPFSIRAILREAMERTHGAKLTLILAGILYFIVYLLVSMGAGMALGLLGATARPAEGTAPVAAMVTNLVVNLLVGGFGTVLGMGLFMIGLRRAVGVPINVVMLFEVLPQFGAVLLAMLLMYVLLFATILPPVGLGIYLKSSAIAPVWAVLPLAIPAIYLMVAYYMAVPLVAEKKLGPWRALEASRKAISRHWFRTFGLVFLLGLINLGGMLALVIGLVWTIPMSIIAFGILYRNMFGVEPATTAVE